MLKDQRALAAYSLVVCWLVFLVTTKPQLHCQVINNVVLLLLLLLLVHIVLRLVLLGLRMGVYMTLLLGVAGVLLLLLLCVRRVGIHMAGGGMLLCCMGIVRRGRRVGGQGHVLRVVLSVGRRVLVVTVDVLSIVSLQDRHRAEWCRGSSSGDRGRRSKHRGKQQAGCQHRQAWTATLQGCRTEPSCVSPC